MSTSLADAEGCRKSILPLTVAEMSAVRYACNRSMLLWVLAEPRDAGKRELRNCLEAREICANCCGADAR